MILSTPVMPWPSSPSVSADFVFSFSRTVLSDCDCFTWNVCLCGRKIFSLHFFIQEFSEKNVSWNIYRCFPCKMLIMNLRMNVQYITKLWKWLLRVCLDACFVLNMCCSCCMRVCMCICMCVYRVGKQEGEDDLLVWRIRLIRVCRSGLADIITTRLQKRRREILRQRKNKRDWQRERV